MISLASSNTYLSESMACGRDQTDCYGQNTDRSTAQTSGDYDRVLTRESAYLGPVGLGWINTLLTFMINNAHVCIEKENPTCRLLNK